MNADSALPLLEMQDIAKRFGKFYALQHVNLTVRAGEIHALMGENGAGKSTLMKILAGAYTASEGHIFVAGEPLVIRNPKQAIDAGITLIYQEINLAPNLTVAENIFLGCEQHRAGWLARNTMIREAERALARLDAQFSATTRVGQLTIAEQQQVEIARALYRNTRILVMDEPTAALSSRETDRLFTLIKKLRDEGIAIIYISHRMAEIDELADRVSVLRDGHYIGELGRDELSPGKLIQMMVGRPLDDLYQRQQLTHQTGEEVLSIDGLTDGHKVKPCSLTVRAGEVVSLAGLVGAGRSELAQLLFGANTAKGGTVRLFDQSLNISSPRDAIQRGIALVPENRKEQGLFLDMMVRDNIIMATADRDAHWGWLNGNSNRRVADTAIARMRIRVPHDRVEARGLSGGNQQKLILSRWLATQPKLLIIDEPTRGVDVGAKSEIYQLVNTMVAEGLAVLMISSELPEVVGMSDRVYVMCEGHIVGELAAEQITQENIMTLATSSRHNDAVSAA